jgi:hypothetical protein
MKRSALILAVLVSLALPATAGAKQYVLKHPRHENCRTHYVRKVEKVKRREHGRTVKVRETFCVYVAPKPVKTVAPATTTPTPVATTPAPTVTAPSPIITLHAHLDPGYVQNPSNPLHVIYSYSASATKTTQGVTSGEPDLPSGILELYNEGLLACSINVGGSTNEGSCPIEYSTYGNHSVVVEYLSGEASTTSGAEIERIEPPAVTNRKTWQPSTASMTITRSTAQVVVSADFHGATHVGLTDNLGDTCTATVTGSEAACLMPVTGEPDSLTVAYPGGSTTSHVEAVAPGGERTVTEEWPADSARIVPTVIAYRATVVWTGWSHGTVPGVIDAKVGESFYLSAGASPDLAVVV